MSTLRQLSALRVDTKMGFPVSLLCIVREWRNTVLKLYSTSHTFHTRDLDRLINDTGRSSSSRVENAIAFIVVPAWGIIAVCSLPCVSPASATKSVHTQE